MLDIVLAIIDEIYAYIHKTFIKHSGILYFIFVR